MEVKMIVNNWQLYFDSFIDTELSSPDSVDMSFYFFSCQTYEGGFGGVPGMEAHGGYSFCGLAALVLLNHERLCDIQALLVSVAWELTLNLFFSWRTLWDTTHWLETIASSLNSGLCFLFVKGYKIKQKLHQICSAMNPTIHFLVTKKFYSPM